MNRLLLAGILLPVQGVIARAGGIGRSPILGWNTWCTQNTCGGVDWCSEQEVLDVASYIQSSGMQLRGWDHIHLDDCWGMRDNVTHAIVADPARFPAGMPSLVSKLHALGFKLGLYTDVGPLGCHHPFVGSYGHYQQDADTFAQWAVDFVKLDGCWRPGDVPAEPNGTTLKELSCNFSNALNQTGKEIWLNYHCWHDAECAACGNSFREYNDHQDRWESTELIINSLKVRQPFWGAAPTYGWPDPDFIYTGGQGCNSSDPGPNHGNPGPSPPGKRCPGQSEAEYMSEFAVWAIAGGQMLLAADPRNMSAFQKKLLFNTEIIAVFLDTSGFRDVKEVDDTGRGIRGNAPPPPHPRCGCAKTKGGKCGCPQIWMRPLDDGGAALVLHNPNDTTAHTFTVHFGLFPKRSWGAATVLAVRDLFEHNDLGMSTGNYTTVHPVGPHGAVFLKLMPA